MDIWNFKTSSPPSSTVFEDIGNFLLKELSSFLKLKLKYFRIDITDTLSFVGTFHNVTPIIKAINLKMEGIILFQINEYHPVVNVEISLFGNDERMGLKKHMGDSYFLLNYSKKSKWYIVTWMLEGIGDKEKIEYARVKEYMGIRKTIST